ncbi:MAG TPA: hypothetical protein EYP04_00540 [Anaerolineae bacterium]|nr:hypothetical protein [Anaerolineae bacterium]HIQ05755.1 hypothetical protein [Anaerolineae bacterium]
MNRRERIAAVLQGEPVIPVPCGELLVDDDFVRAYVGSEPGEGPAPWAARRAVLERLGHDLVVVAFSQGWGASEQPDEEDALFLVSHWKKETDFFVCALVDGLFGAAVHAWGWEEALTRLTRAPSRTEEFMAETVVEREVLFQRLAAAGADGVIIGDDIAYQRGPYVRLNALRQTYFPFLRILAERADALGLYVVFHSDGNLWTLLDDLIKTEINGLQGLEPEAGMSLAAVREHVGSRFCLWGNVDLGWLAQPRSPEVIAAHVEEILVPVLGTPVIFGTCAGLIAGLPPSNVDALYAAARATGD